MRLFLISGHVITKRSDVLIGLPSIGNVGQVNIMIIIDGNICMIHHVVDVNDDTNVGVWYDYKRIISIP